MKAGNFLLQNCKEGIEPAWGACAGSATVEQPRYRRTHRKDIVEHIETVELEETVEHIETKVFRITKYRSVCAWSGLSTVEQPKYQTRRSLDIKNNLVVCTTSACTF